MPWPRELRPWRTDSPQHGKTLDAAAGFVLGLEPLELVFQSPWGRGMGSPERGGKWEAMTLRL